MDELPTCKEILSELRAHQAVGSVLCSKGVLFLKRGLIIVAAAFKRIFTVPRCIIFLACKTAPSLPQITKRTTKRPPSAALRKVSSTVD